MRIHTIYTGGTIGMVQTPNGLAPGADVQGWLEHLIEGSVLAADQVSFTALEPLIDSSNATPENWQAIIDELRKHRSKADAFVVLHGTDTMAYTAAALSYALADFDKSVVLTGSQLPIGQLGSDAATNVMGALTAVQSGKTAIRGSVQDGAGASSALATALSGSSAVQGSVRVGAGATGTLSATSDSPTPSTLSAASGGSTSRTLPTASGGFAGVTLFFGQHLFAGTRVSKTSSWAFEGFSSTTGPLACAGAPWRWLPKGNEGCGWESPLPYTRHDVAVIDMVPGITAARVKSMLAPLPEAVILRAYGAGNMPSEEPGFTDVLAEAIEAGVPVIVASQCADAAVIVGHYEASDVLGRAGAVGAGDMTFEALYAKVVFLLSQGLKGQELAAWIGKSIAGEITE